MKFIHCADLHIGKSRGLHGYLERQDKMLSGIYRLAAKLSDGLVVIAGDIYDRLDLTAREKDLFIQHVARADKSGIVTVMVSGNHDMIDEDDGGYTHLRALKVMADQKRLTNTFVVETHPESFVLDKFDLPVIAVPSYYRKAKEVNKIVMQELDKLGTAARNKKVLAVVHECILGAKNDFGKRMGIDLGSKDDCAELDPSMPVTYWALGDIHRAQKINGCPTAWYCGTPIQHDFGDLDDRGVLLVDLDEPESPELLPIPGIKRMVTLEVTEDTQAEDIPSDAYVRLEGTRDRIKALKGTGANVVATKLRAADEVAVIEDVKISDALHGLPEMLAEMGMSASDQKWCLEEAERLR